MEKTDAKVRLFLELSHQYPIQILNYIPLKSYNDWNPEKMYEYPKSQYYYAFINDAELISRMKLILSKEYKNIEEIESDVDLIKEDLTNQRISLEFNGCNIEIFEDLEDIEMRSKTELNEENKKTKTKLKNNKKIENKAPIVFIQKKTLRKEDEEDKKIKKKNSDLYPKTKTEIDYQIKKKNNPYDLDKIYNDFTEDENYYNLYKYEEKNDDEFIETLDELDFKTNKNKHANTIQDNYDIPKELNMEITSNNK
jgi:hypothetical protein